jgi:hypothetical protein
MWIAVTGPPGQRIVISGFPFRGGAGQRITFKEMPVSGSLIRGTAPALSGLSRRSRIAGEYLSFSYDEDAELKVNTFARSPGHNVCEKK